MTITTIHVEAVSAPTRGPSGAPDALRDGEAVCERCEGYKTGWARIEVRVPSSHSGAGTRRTQKVCCFPCQEALSGSVPVGRAQPPLWSVA